MTDSTPVSRHRLIVVETPEIFATVNGVEDAYEIYLEPDESLTVECYAIHAKPAVYFTWIVNNMALDVSKTVSTVSPNPENMGTFNSQSVYRNEKPNKEGNISCITSAQSAQLQQSVTIKYLRYASPNLAIVINGQHVQHAISVLPDETIHAICIANGSSSLLVNLTWLINGKKLIDSEENTSIKYGVYNRDEVTEHQLNLQFLPEFKTGNLTCSAKGKNIEETFVVVFYKVKETIMSSEENIITNSPPKAIFATMALILLPVICYCVYKGSKVLREIYRNTSNHSRCGTNLTDITNLSSQVASRNNESLNRSRMVLPDIPNCEECPDTYANVIDEDDTLYYSTLTTNKKQKRMFSESDMCLVFNLKMGELINRWMGSISESNKRSKSVVISTASEAVLIAKHFNWDAFVRRVMELPDSVNLVKTEGLCVDGTNLYLLHEYVICKTLEARLNFIKSNKMCQLDPLEFARHTLGILEGIEVIHSYGFLHPGLSTKKILLTKQGNCKLYDFCLKEDASHILVLKKSKDTIFARTIPPESVLRNEYFPASDVWSAALVIWEMLSGGLPSFFDKDYVQDGEVSHRHTLDSWPENFLQFRNDLLQECWQKDFSSRPTTQNLRFSFKEIFEQFMGQKLEKACSPTLDLYVPMKEVPESGDDT